MSRLNATNGTLLSALNNNTPFIYAHLVKFERAISEETTNFGDSFSILINSHISRVEKLNLIPLRGGKYPTTTKVDGGTANLLG